MSAQTESPERKVSIIADERYVQGVRSNNGHAVDGLSEAHRKALTRKILWKLDLWILPVLTLLFLCSFLDRTNVGNAKTYGLEAGLHMTDPQYQTGLAVYYATYIAVEIPSNLVLRKISPKIWLPFLTIVWGIITMCLGFVRNYAGFVAVRALLGVAEGGLLPGMVLYLSGMYTRTEMALRLGIFYTAASLSGAFGGLLARGLHEIGTVGKQLPWSWIFIIEGIFTVVIGVGAYFILPNTIATAKFLNEEERTYHVSRLVRDMPVVGVPVNADGTIDESFQWKEVVRGLLSPSTWLSACAYFGILSGLYSFGLYLPSIIVALGYTANQAQLLSVIPYAVASVFTVAVSFISDRLKLRGVIMLFTLPIAIIGYAVIANIGIHHPKVKFGMTFLMATGMYASVPCVLVWNSNNSAGHYKRATTTALQLMIANSGGFVATFVYPNADKPQYHKGHTIIMSLLVAAWLLVLFNVVYCWWINKCKAAGNYDQYAGLGHDDRDPEFKLVL